MEQIYYIYDGEKNGWIESSEAWVKDDIENFNIEFVSDGTAEISTDNIGMYKNNAYSKRLLAYINLDYAARHDGYRTAVARWRVQFYREQRTVIIYADCYNVRVSITLKHFPGIFDGEYIHNIESFKNSPRQYSLRLDYGKWKYTAIPAKSHQAESGGNTFNYRYDWTEPEFDFSVEIPAVVVARVMSFMEVLATEEFGFKPVVTQNIPGNLLLKYYVQYPLDVGVGYYVDMLGYDFANKVLRKTDSNFELVCDYLGLPKTAGLKKAYHENALALAYCWFLKEIGIDDLNIWKYFYDGKFLMGTSLTRLGIDRSGEMYRKAGGSWRCWWSTRGLWDKERYDEYIARDKDKYNTRYIGWHLLYTWLLEKWGVQRTGEILSDVLKNTDYDKYDCFVMWLSDYCDGDFPEEFVQAIYRSGFSREAHDIRNELYMQDYNRKASEMKKIEFKLTRGELAREEETALGAIKVARSGNDLFLISENMHNCVFRIYTEKSQKKRCTIYYLQKDDEYMACIEVVNGVVVQAFGKYNRVLLGELRSEIKDWCIRNNLTFAPVE